MTNELLEKFTGNMLEESFQIRTFAGIKSANRWLLAQKNIEVLSFHVGRLFRIGPGKMVPGRVTIAYRTKAEDSGTYYGISKGLEYCYDGDELKHSLDVAWKHCYPNLQHVSDQEELCRGIRTEHRKYYLLYEAPRAKDGCEDVLVETQNVFKEENHSGQAARKYQIMQFLTILFTVLFTGIWYGATRGAFAASPTIVRFCSVFMYCFDGLLFGQWLYQTVLLLKKQRK